jgi:hypothetical protein
MGVCGEEVRGVEGLEDVVFLLLVVGFEGFRGGELEGAESLEGG